MAEMESREAMLSNAIFWVLPSACGGATQPAIETKILVKC
jgi:hypothetical protein